MVTSAHTTGDRRICPDCIFITFVDWNTSRANALNDICWVFLKMFVAIVTNKLGWLRIAILFVLSASVEVRDAPSEAVMATHVSTGLLLPKVFTYVWKSFHTHSSLFAASIDCSVNSCSVRTGCGEGGLGSCTGSFGNGSGGFVFMTLNTTTKPRKPSNILASSRSLGIHICHLDGFFQKSLLAGVQTGGGVSGSWNSCVSFRRPISERLPVMVSRLVISLGATRSTL